MSEPVKYLDPEPDPQKWLKRLADELLKTEPLLPLKFLPTGVEYPPWVQNVEKEFALVVYPVARLRETDQQFKPRKMGALLGHMCEKAVWMIDYFGQQAATAVKTQPELTANENLKILAQNGPSFDAWYQAMRRLAKRALCSSVDQTYEDMSEFLLGYAEAFASKPKTFQVGNLGNPTFEIYTFMLTYWQSIERLNSVRELHALLVKHFGASRIGDQKRIEKICQRIGLSFRKPGRPAKK